MNFFLFGMLAILFFLLFSLVFFMGILRELFICEILFFFRELIRYLVGVFFVNGFFFLGRDVNILFILKKLEDRTEVIVRNYLIWS